MCLRLRHVERQALIPEAMLSKRDAECQEWVQVRAQKECWYSWCLCGSGCWRSKQSRRRALTSIYMCEIARHVSNDSQIVFPYRGRLCHAGDGYMAALDMDIIAKYLWLGNWYGILNHTFCRHNGLRSLTAQSLPGYFGRIMTACVCPLDDEVPIMQGGCGAQKGILPVPGSWLPNTPETWIGLSIVCGVLGSQLRISIEEPSFREQGSRSQKCFRKLEKQETDLEATELVALWWNLPCHYFLWRNPFDVSCRSGGSGGVAVAFHLRSVFSGRKGFIILEGHDCRLDIPYKEHMVVFGCVALCGGDPKSK